MENSNSAQEAAWYCHEVVQMLATLGIVLETKQRSRSPNIYAEKCPEHCHVHAGLLESPLGSQSHFCKTEHWYRTRDGQMQRLQRVLNPQYIPNLLQYLMGSTAVRSTFCIGKKPIANFALRLATSIGMPQTQTALHEYGLGSWSYSCS